MSGIYRYATLMRPPGLGACPMEGLVSCCYEEGISPSGHHFWGWCTYARELTPDEIWSYELEQLPQEEH